MISFFGKLMRNKRGNALAIAAACLPLFVGAAGLATDTIQWTLWKRQLQRAADSAAIAGVYNREANSGATNSVDATVSHDLDLNLHTFYTLQTGKTNCSGKCVLAFPANAGVVQNQVQVTIAIQQPLTFSSMFMTSAPTIVATSTAAAISAGGDACVQALEPTAVTGITNGGNTNLDMPKCVMYSNSPSANSASAGGSSTVNALAIAAVGGIAQSANWHVGAYRPYSPSLTDPFSKINPDPGDMNCTTDALDEKTDFSKLATGTNCFSSLSVGSNKTVTIPSTYSGPIYINGGDANLQGAFTCASCTIVLTNKDPSPTATIGTIKSNAQATNNITAPTDGTYKGIAVFQDRRAPDCTGCNKINGGSSSVITGAIYFPSQELWYNGGSTPITVSTCTMIVARRITFTGNSKFKSMGECSAEGEPQNNTLRMVRLVG